METKLIKIREYCQFRNVESTFIDLLNESGLLAIIIQKDEAYIDVEQLKDLEKFANWHDELELNIQGIEVTHHLVQKIEILQAEIDELKSQIRAIQA